MDNTTTSDHISALGGIPPFDAAKGRLTVSPSPSAGGSLEKMMQERQEQNLPISTLQNGGIPLGSDGVDQLCHGVFFGRRQSHDLSMLPISA